MSEPSTVEHPAGDGGGGSAAGGRSLAGVTVMVIDDSRTIRRTAESLLCKVGCRVITASDGFESLATIVETRPDIIFVDIMMPRLDGYQTCALIKQNPEFRDTPVVMLSSKDGLFDRARGRLVGCDHYLVKPFTRSELLTTIAAHVGEHPRGGRGERGSEPGGTDA